ncbi:DUF5130 family protein [Nakamurella endophytica]|uniref:DUF5130 family protein n=1 Tax=Nakamurella endophytica TaxID=1748367 RepID=A0A917T1X3_9ACTN|nr:DUF5130 family protein [Nakamurella endophytica]GGM06912.1 hypothetical protein GCM10011594_28640 [Nakamurella endophytica]
MATGEVATRSGSSPALQDRQPGVRRPPVGPQGFADLPFDAQQLDLLDGVIAEAEQTTGLRFSVYLGEMDAGAGDTRAFAVDLLRGLGHDAPAAVLLAVSPGQRAVEIVTGALAARRISDRAARLAVISVVSSAKDGDLLGALTNGVRTLADQAGALPQRSSW